MRVRMLSRSAASPRAAALAQPLGEHAREHELHFEQVDAGLRREGDERLGMRVAQHEQAHRDLARRARLCEFGEHGAGRRGVGSSPARRASAGAPSVAPRTSERRLRRSCSA